MSWLSHFTGWVGEKKSTLLPIVTGLAGFAAGLLPGVGGALSKQVDKWGAKLSDASDSLDSVNGIVSPGSRTVTAVEPASLPTTSTDTVQRPAPAGNGPSPMLIGGGILLAALLFGGSSNRR